MDRPFNYLYCVLAVEVNKLGDEANNFTVENQLEYAAECAKFETEYMWIHAGWFEGRWPDGVGNWFVRKDGFPDGLRPLTDAFKEMGMKFLLWFEPERVHVGTLARCKPS